MRTLAPHHKVSRLWHRVPEATVRRVRTLIHERGFRCARDLLHVSEHTLNEARGEGRLREDTIARIEAALTELGA